VSGVVPVDEEHAEPGAGQRERDRIGDLRFTESAWGKELGDGAADEQARLEERHRVVDLREEVGHGDRPVPDGGDAAGHAVTVRWRCCEAIERAQSAPDRFPV